MATAALMFACSFGFFALAWGACRYLCPLAMETKSALASLFLFFAYWVCGMVGVAGALAFGIATPVAIMNAIYSTTQ